MTMKIKTDSDIYHVFDTVQCSIYYGINDYPQLEGQTLVLTDNYGLVGLGIESKQIPITINNVEPIIVSSDVNSWSALRNAPVIHTNQGKEGITCTVNTSFGNKTSLTALPLDCDTDWILNFKVYHNIRREGYIEWGFVHEDDMTEYVIGYLNESGYILSEYPDSDRINVLSGIQLSPGEWTDVKVTCTNNNITIEYIDKNNNNVCWTAEGYGGIIYLTGHCWSSDSILSFTDISLEEYKTTFNMILDEDNKGVHVLSAQNFSETRFEVIDNRRELFVNTVTDIVNYKILETDDSSYRLKNQITLLDVEGTPYEVGLNVTIEYEEGTPISCDIINDDKGWSTVEENLIKRGQVILKLEFSEEYIREFKWSETTSTEIITNVYGITPEISLERSIPSEINIYENESISLDTIISTNQEKVRFTILDTTGNIIKQSNVIGSVIENVNSANYTITSGLPEGTYHVLIEVEGTTTYEPASMTLNNFLAISPKINTHFFIQSPALQYYNGTQFKKTYLIQVLDEDNNPIDCAISIILDNGESKNYNTINRVITWDMLVNTPGNHTVKLVYEGTRKYNSLNHLNVFTISYITTTIDSADVIAYSTRNCSIPLSLKAQYIPFDTSVLKTVPLSNKSVSIWDFDDIQLQKIGEITTDNQGNANFIYNNSEVGRHKVQIEFPGDNTYSRYTKDIYVNVLERTVPTISASIEDNIYGYNMKIHANIKNTKDEPLNNELLELYEDNNNLIGSGQTDTNGEIIFNYIVNKVGNYTWRIHYSETDPYTEVNINLPVELLKDTPILSMITDKNIYTDGQNGLLTLILQDSQGRPITNANLKLTDHENEKIALLTTDNTGKSTYVINAFAGLRQYNGISPETNYYYNCSNYVIVNYDINKTFRVKFRNNKAILPIDNMVIPLGLYDVDMHYLGFEDYGQSYNNQGIDVKKATYFRILSPNTPINSEAMIPVDIVAQLYDINGTNLVNKEVVSKINSNLSLTHVTDSEGCVNRVYPETPLSILEKKRLALRAQDKVGTTDIFTFVYGHTLKLASSKIEVPVTWTRITPTLELDVPEIIYADVPVNINAELYYTRFNQKIPITNQKITFKDDNNITLFSVTTDSEGKSTYKYINNNSGQISGTVKFNKTNIYNNVSTDFNLNILDRPTPNLIVHDITAEYNIPCNLYASLKDENGNALPNYKIQFKQDSILLGEAITDNSGNVLVTYTPNKVGTHNIQAIFTRPDKNCIYNSITQTFNLIIDKATPTLEFTIPQTQDKTTFKYGTPLTIQLKLKHNTQLIPTNNYIVLKETTEQNKNSSTTILSERLNNGELNTTINTIRPNTNTINLFARYGESTNYKSVDSELININIEKLDTYLVPLEQETYKKVITKQYNNIEYNEQITTYATLFYKNYKNEILPVQNTQIIAVHEATDGGPYLNGGSGKHTLLSNTNSEGIAKFTPIMLYKEGTITYTLKFEESNLLKAPTINPEWKIQIIKGQINFILEDISTQPVYAGLKKTNPTDKIGIHLQLNAKDNNNKILTALPIGANALTCIVDSAFIYDSEGNNPQREEFNITTFPYDFYVSSGSIWNTNDQGIRDVGLHLYSHNIYQATNASTEVTLLERDTYLNYKIYNKDTNQELPKITNQYGTGYSVTLPEQIYIKGTLKYKLVPGDIGYSSNTMGNVTGENYSRELLNQCETIYQESETRAKNDPNFNAQNWLALQMKTLGLNNPENLIRIGLINQNNNTEENTGYQLAIIDGEFSSNDSINGFELNASAYGGITNVTKHSFIEVLYRNTQSFIIKGISEKIELFLKKAPVDITFNASSTTINSGSSVTFSGKVTWLDANGTSHNMESCNTAGLGLCIYINNTTKEVNISSDGTYTYNYTHNGSSYAAKMYFRGAIVKGEDYYEPKYSSTKNITVK